MEPNPYESPRTDTESRRRPNRVLSRVETAILVLGLAALAYGAFSFWIVPSLPPNTGWSGRLPSLYVMGTGIVAAVVGLTINSMQGASPTKGSIPIGIGIMVILVVVIAFFVAVSRL